MFVYSKKLQYPVKIANANPRLASLIISQYGGPDGELGASLRYLSQRYAMPFDELKALLTDIGTSVSVMTREKKPREEVNSKGILVDYILTNEKLLRYGKNNHFGMNDISTRVARGDERHIRVFAALSNDNT